MELHQAQKEIVNDLHRFRVVNCGRRFGKTTLSVLEIIGKAVIKENQKIAYIAPTYQQARDIAWNEFKQHLPIGSSAQPDYNESRLEVKVNNGSLIQLKGWESIESLRGQSFHYLVIDEIAMMRNFWINWQEVIRPTLTDYKGEVLFISTPKGFNHFYDLYNMQDDPEKGEDYKSFHYTSYDNPFIPVDELNKAKKEVTEDRFAQEYLADFRKTQGLVYKEFDRDKHLVGEEEFPEHYIKKMAGLDFGFTNPTAVYTIYKDHDARYWITDEYYKTGKTDEEVAEYVAAMEYQEVYPDPNNAPGVEVLRRKRVNLRDVIKGKESVTNGINVVRELFKQNRLFIDKDCKNLIWELETYSYPDKKDKHNEDEVPIKENDHAMDAIRYALMMESSGIGSKTVHIYRPKTQGFNIDQRSKVSVNRPGKGFNRGR